MASTLIHCVTDGVKLQASGSSHSVWACNGELWQTINRVKIDINFKIEVRHRVS